MAGHMASQSPIHTGDAHRNQASILVVIVIIAACKIIFVDGKQGKQRVHDGNGMERFGAPDLIQFVRAEGARPARYLGLRS